MTTWFITSYNEDLNARPHPRRWCMMDTYTLQINVDGGQWEEIECGANFAIVKVKASLTTLQIIAQDANMTRIPVNLLSDTLSSLTTAQKTKLQTLLNNMGYTNQEILTAMGSDIGSKTLGDLLRFIITRRIPPRFDTNLKQIIFDLPHVSTNNNLDDIDRRIQ